MSNNFYNFLIPYFSERYGEDWAAFKTVMEDNFDHTFQKIWELYHLVDINKMSARVVQFHLDLRKIPYDSNDTLKTKKLRLRTWVAKERKKALADIYLDLAEGVTGITGTLWSGKDIGVWRWEYSRWAGPEVTDTTLQRWDTATGRWEVARWFAASRLRTADILRWGQDLPQFVIYFDVKTTDNTELDQIVSLLQDGSILPAFYLIYLCDSDFNILRTVTI